MNKKVKKALEVISDILLVLILIVAIVITVMTFTSKNSDVGVGNVFGYTPFTIKSDSMAPTFKTGDMIICKEVKNVNDLEVGDVITYSTVMTDADGRRVRDNNTHRITEIVYNESDGTINHFVTQGDAMKMEDPVPVTPDDILAKQVNSGEGKTGLKIAGLGHALDFLQSRTGFMICIIIPLALFFIWQIYKLIMMFMESKAEEIDEETKRKAIEEYLAKQEAEKEGKNKEFKSENDYEYPKDSGPKTEEKASSEKESE